MLGIPSIAFSLATKALFLIRGRHHPRRKLGSDETKHQWSKPPWDPLSISLPPPRRPGGSERITRKACPSAPSSLLWGDSPDPAPSLILHHGGCSKGHGGSNQMMLASSGDQLPNGMSPNHCTRPNSTKSPKNKPTSTTTTMDRSSLIPTPRGGGARGEREGSQGNEGDSQGRRKREGNGLMALAQEVGFTSSY